jgi:hypothetical protein
MSKYRTVSSGHNVDESLFGESQSTRVKSAKAGSRTATRPVSGSSVGSSVAPKAVVISQQELNRIKANAILKSEAELAAEREEARRQKDERDRQARERKEKMKQLEIQAASKAKLDDFEVERLAKEKAIREEASKKLDDRSDVVKTLNSMSARAVAFTLREKQLEEKKRREAIEREYDRSLDIAMEIDRIKDLQRRESEEESKRHVRLQGRSIINEQMAQRQRAKDIAAEYREQENLSMRNLMQKYAADDAAAAAAKQEEIARTRLVIKAANEAAISKKLEAKEASKKEMEDILIYQAQRDAELAKREEDERLLAHAKKERQAMLLAQQERAQNNQDKLDEIRARRATQERERRDRMKEKEDREKRVADIAELQRARAAQAADKKSRKEAEEVRKMDEYRDALHHMQDMASREAEEKQKRQALANEHRHNLGKQISDIEQNRHL